MKACSGLLLAENHVFFGLLVRAPSFETPIEVLRVEFLAANISWRVRMHRVGATRQRERHCDGRRVPPPRVVGPGSATRWALIFDSEMRRYDLRIYWAAGASMWGVCHKQ